MNPYIKSFSLAIVTFVGVSLLLGIVHEYGHALACEAYGGDFDMHLGILITNYGTCHNDKSPEYVIGLAGGGIAALVATASIGLVRRNWYTTAVGTLAIGQAAMMIAETFVHEAYILNQTNGIIGAVIMASFGGLAVKTKMIKFKRKAPPAT